MKSAWNPWLEVVICRRGWENEIPPTSTLRFLRFKITNSPVQAFMAQIAVCAFFTGTTDYMLRPCGFSSFFSKMLGAIIIGPTMLGRLDIIKEYVFPYSGIHALEVLHYMGNIFFPFVAGLKMDLRMANGAGRNAKVIGLTVGIVPILIACLTAFILKLQYYPTDDESDEKLSLILCSVAVTGSQTPLPDVASLLVDFKILNSEIGKLAIGSSMISSFCSWLIMTIIFTILKCLKYKEDYIGIIGLLLSLVVLIVCALRPIMLWMIKQLPQGTKNMKETHVFIVFLMVICCSSIGQSLGHSPGMGPLILGMVIPPGPPLAETLEDKLESIVSNVLLPLFYVGCIGKVSTGEMDRLLFTFVMLIMCVSFLVKIIAAVLSSLYCGLMLNDSLVLGLTVATPGVLNLIYTSSSLRYRFINKEVYGVLVYFLVVKAAITSLLVKVMYRPPIEYFSDNKRTLGDIMHNSKFRILACIYQDSNVPGIINLLEASNATDESPINLYLLRLIELQRIAPPFLLTHKRDNDRSIYYNRSKHIINAFRSFEKQFREKFSLTSYFALSPCSTMHQDICSLALTQRVSLIILPFHRQLNLDGIIEAKTTIRNVNSSVLKLSSCTVGILIDRHCSSVCSSIAESKSSYRIVLIFLGGADDREVLTYGMRMAVNPRTNLTLIHFSIAGNTNNNSDKDLDVTLLNNFRHKYIRMEGITYREELVSNSLQIAKRLREVKDRYDLIMVGRQHGNEWKLFEGVSQWNEYPELGFMGDMLATSNLLEDVPILVLQQNLHSSNDLLLRSNYSTPV